jgi:hypothetical protein
VQGAIGAGVQGAPGSQGPQGPAGVGAQGPQGAQGPSLFIIASAAPSLATTPVGAAWWDLDNGRTFICYDDGSSKQWVEFIGAPGVTGAQGPQGSAGVIGPQGPQGVGSSPAAPTNAIQYNNAGAFGGSVKLQYTGTQLLLDTTVGLGWGLTGYLAGISSISLATLEINNGTKGQRGRLNLDQLYADHEVVAGTLTSNGDVNANGNLNATGAVLTGGIQCNRVFPNDGTAAAPSYTFISDPTIGFFRSGSAVGLSLVTAPFSYRWSSSYFSLSSSAGIAWAAAGDASTVGDVALNRETTNTLQVNNAAGAYADLKLRNLPASGTMQAGYVTLPSSASVLTNYGQSNLSAVQCTTFSCQGLTLGSVATTGVDLSKHISLFSTSYGLNITSGTLNIVSSGVAYPFTAAGFTSPGTIGAAGNINGRDLLANRGNGTAAYYYLDTTRYMYFDGGRLNINNVGPISTDSFLGVGTGYTVSPVTSLDVKVTGNAHFIATYNSGFPVIGIVADGFTAWADLAVHGSTTFWPLVDNTLTLGGSGHRWKQLWSVAGAINTSDARQKKNIQDSPLGLDFIESLHPVSYQWIVGQNITSREPDGEEIEPGYTKIDGEVVPPKSKIKYKDVVTPVEGKRTHYGLIAQEVAQAVQASGVVDFGGYVQADMNDPESELGLNYSEFIGPLIKAVQELSARVKDLEAQLVARK